MSIRCLILIPFVLSAQSPEDLFTARIQPVLERDCQGCHGATQALSKLDLRTRESLLKGGVRGPSVTPGNAANSILIHALEGRNRLLMPPGKPLAPETIAAFRTWIDSGAPWPEKTTAAKWGYKPEDLWAFQPLRKFDDAKRIDDFILARLKELKIRPAPQADKRTLIRRVTLDLTGLPPTPEEAEAFVNDRSPKAWEKLVDRLLASPRYGERWGRHWLDVVRYADTSGYSNDFERPNAWRYRDYVIRAFNNDKPYDRFILEQIAADELFPGDPEALIATGFLRAGPWEHTAMSVEAVTRQLFLDDVTHATASTFLGLTLGCARCHDHKFDPIPTRDYYRMQAAFTTSEFARPRLPFLKDENATELPEGAAYMRAILDRTRAKMRELGAKQGKEVTEEYKLFQKHAQLYQESLDRYQPKAFAVSSGPLDGATDGGPSLKYPKRAEYKPAATHILTGGNIQSPADPVTPGVLSALAKFGNYPPADVPQTVEGRRAAVAKWIADARNPLTARVMVNRIWQYHFGRGIAADANNFGKMGKKPSHPELLDWLANYFIANKWSVKAVHRAILMTDAYRRAGAKPHSSDPDNTLLAHYTPRRMEAEAIRDSVLAVSGELSLETGGPGTFPQINEDVARQPQHRMGSLAPPYRPSPLKRQRNRRTIYTFQQRSLIDPMVEVFNGPGPDLSCERRDSSIVPTQAFALFNSQFAHDSALAFAARLEKERPTLDARIRRAFELAYGRAPEARELDLAREHIAQLTRHHKKTTPPPRPESKPLVHKITSELTGETFEFIQQEDPAPYEPNLHPSDVSPETRALADFALVLLNSNEFIYVY